jgi:hypothetical protein
MKFVMLQAYVLLFCDWYLFHVPLPYLHQGIPYHIGGNDMTSSYSIDGQQRLNILHFFA